MLRLPIDEFIPEIQKAFLEHSQLLIHASPGSGKTTRVPIALSQKCSGQILVLEPRRIAARLSAERVASELGEQSGQTIGYQIRFEKSESSATRVKYITDGLFAKLVLSDPSLLGISAIILDEFHERNLNTDLALMLSKFIQDHIRPDFKIVIMSATLDIEQLKSFFPFSRLFTCEVPAFPVDISYLTYEELKRPKHIVFLQALKNCAQDHRCSGHILVFLSGTKDINEAWDTITNDMFFKDFLVLPLKADLSWEEQEQVFSESQKRKIILSTNVAETSVTIPGVTAVIDFGLARTSGFNPSTGIPTLVLKPISKASCIQRAGRAGRTSAGIVKRMMTLHDYNQRPSFEKPEIQRSDLASIVLELKKIENSLNKPFVWFENPDEKSLRSAELLLIDLGFISEHKTITSEGNLAVLLPLHPRLAKVYLAAKNKKCFFEVVACICSLLEGFMENISHKYVSQNDLSLLLHKFKVHSFRPQVKRARALFQRLTGHQNIPHHVIHEQDVRMCFLAGYADRLAKKGLNNVLALADGGAARLSDTSSVQDSPFLIGLDLEEVPSSSVPMVNTAIGYDVSELALLNLNELREHYWDKNAERVRSVTRIYYRSLVVEEKLEQIASREAEEILARAIKEQWDSIFQDSFALTELQIRIQGLKKYHPSHKTLDFSHDDFELLLAHIAEGKSSLSEVKQRSLTDYLEDLLDPSTRDLLDRIAPLFIHVGQGRKVKIHYEEDKPHWAQAFIQDFYGLKITPVILGEPLVIHLLAPNKLPLQVTKDLEGFWQREYPKIKSEYQRRYPRHFWPEDPQNAEPPALRGPKVLR